MAYECTRSVSLEVISASADIPLRRFVTFKVTNGLALPGSAGDPARIVGTTLETYDHSEVTSGNGSNVVPVALIDGAKLEIEAGEALPVGTWVIAGDDGRAMASTATAGTNLTAGAHQELGSVVIAAGGAGEVATIQTKEGQFLTLS